MKIRIEGKDGREPCEYIAIAKTDQLKFKWKDSINKARDVINPKVGKKRLHCFELINFDTPEKCSVCRKFLYGCYFQGYRCNECKAVSHWSCLENQSTCQAVRPKRPPQQHQQPQHLMLGPQSSLDRLDSTRIATSKKNLNGSEDPKQRKIYFASQRYNAIGPRRDTFLSFDRNDEIVVVKDTDHDWWEGIHVKTGQRGFVSPNFLKKSQTTPTLQPQPLQPIGNNDPSSSIPGGDILAQTRRKLSEYPWYDGMHILDQ
jgi:hypothetical protein